MQANAVDSSLPILSFWSSKNEAQNSEDGSAAPVGTEAEKTMTTKKTALIASSAALAAIVLGVAGFFGSRFYLRKKARDAHRRRGSVAVNHRSEEFASADAAVGFNPDDRAEELMTGHPTMQNAYQGNGQWPPSYNGAYAGTPGQAGPPMTGRSMAQTPKSAYPLPSGRRTPGRGDDGRTLFEDASPEALATAAIPNGSYPDGYMNTMRSGSGSSVQSDVLQTRRRQSSLELADPGRSTWWRHESQWGPPETAGARSTRGPETMDPRPYSEASSNYSTVRKPTFTQGHGQARLRNESISMPYLQDNSLML